MVMTLCVLSSHCGKFSETFLWMPAVSPVKWGCSCWVAQSCSALCNPMGCSSTGSSAHEIFQTRILEWVPISFSRGSAQLRDWTHICCIDRQIFFTTEPPGKPKVRLIVLKKYLRSIIQKVKYYCVYNNRYNNIYNNSYNKYNKIPISLGKEKL